MSGWFVHVCIIIGRVCSLSLCPVPRDAHAWTSLDSSERAFKVDYAMQAALKRTKIEFDKTSLGFSEEMCRLILDRRQGKPHTHLSEFNPALKTRVGQVKLSFTEPIFAY